MFLKLSTLCLVLNLFQPDVGGGVQMLPAADLVTVHQMFSTLTGLLLLEPKP